MGSIASQKRKGSMTISHEQLEEGNELLLDWEKLRKVAAQSAESVIPVAVQDADSLQVLILAYANEKALLESFRRKVCVLWSTSRNQLWVKGETSGDVLDLVDVRVNCEQNSLLYLVRPRNTGACHTKGPDGTSRPSCYYRRLSCTGSAEDGSADPSLVLEPLGTSLGSVKTSDPEPVA